VRGDSHGDVVVGVGIGRGPLGERLLDLQCPQIPISFNDEVLNRVEKRLIHL
jgi:hypothetical protein